MTGRREWQPDVLGAHFEQLTLPLGTDDQGVVEATLVRYTPPPGFTLRPGAARGANVLYVHGWSDYFFQTHLAEFWHAAGARFYALDLRKYGRSLREGQTPGYITDLATYDEDLDAALEVIGDDRPLILLGHSTGGLTLSLWADRNPGRAAALVLNSPWLEFQARELGRAALAPMIELQARYRPLDQLPRVDLGFYTRSVSSRFEGSWDYDFQWRPEHGFPVHPAWLSAVLAGHAKVAMGLHLDIPVLTLLSARSTLLPRWNPAMLSSDTALDVEIVAQRALKLGPTVSVGWLDGALHDVFLSAPEVRGLAFEQITRWLNGYRP
jgi:alpha-beta hydrolase superfamily lysophospholipase